jgi:hypothetical protein
LNVTTLLRKGEHKPQVLADDEIRALLANSMKVNFVKEAKRDLFNQALGAGNIIFYDAKLSKIFGDELIQPND